MSNAVHPASAKNDLWGLAPWRIDFVPPKQPLPEFTDFAIIGAGFTGLAAGAWLRTLAPEKSVVILEAGRIGAGASGRTGGMVLSETAAGDLPGLGDVLQGLLRILRELAVDGELELPGAWEIARSDDVEKSKNGHPLPGPSPIDWEDSGRLRVVNVVPGGTLDPGKQVCGLARAAVERGAVVLENSAVSEIQWKDPMELQFANGGRLRARKVLFATNALSADLTAIKSRIFPKLTLAARTAPLREDQIKAIGLAEHKPFYTADFPYLWGRLSSDNSIVWGAGLVDAPATKNLEDVDITAEPSASMFKRFEVRIRRLHPALASAEFTHMWGGPIAFRQNFRPVFTHRKGSRNGIVLGVFAGHGVALSVFLGAWAAEAMLGRRELPEWGQIAASENNSKLW